MRWISRFVFGACFPVAFCALACLAEGKSPAYAVYAVTYSLPSAILFLILGAAWDLFLFLTEGSLRDDGPKEEGPIILEPPPRKRRGPGRSGRS